MLFAERGELMSVEFRSVNRMGRDVYEISFENLVLEIVLGLDEAGTVPSVDYRHVIAGGV